MADKESLFEKQGFKHTLEDWEKGGKTGSNPWLYSEDLSSEGWKDWFKDYVVGIKDYEYHGLPEDATYKDYMFELQKSQQPNQYNTKKQWSEKKDEIREKILIDINEKFPDRKLKDKEGKEQVKRTPFMEGDKPFEETDVTEAILKGNLKRPPDPYEGPFGKLGEYFSKNAAARDKLFQYIGSMGKELVKPIQPGQEAAGALVPTLARGMERGEADYAAKQAAQAKHMLDIASAQQKINPLQYYTNAMKEAIAQMPEDTEPNTAAGKSWIANYLRQKGIPKAAVDISSAIESFDMKMQMTSDEEEKKRIQALINEQYRLLEDILSGSIGGSSVTDYVPYMPS